MTKEYCTGISRQQMIRDFDAAGYKNFRSALPGNPNSLYVAETKDGAIPTLFTSQDVLDFYKDKR